MIISAAIISKEGNTFYSDRLPHDFKTELKKHARNFLYSLSIENHDAELPYLETTNLRYVYKQTDDLYWLLVTKPESDMFSDIDLLGKYVCIIMEYGAAETSSRTLTDEQRELFYRHLWRPWDEESDCEACGRLCSCNSVEFWEERFRSRLEFLSNIRDGRVDEKDVNYFNGLVAESWSISEQLASENYISRQNDDGFLSESASLCSSGNQSISEETVIDGCRLKCLLEDIKLALRRIQDPYLRLFARRDLLVGAHFDDDRVKTGTAPAIGDLSMTDPCS